MHRKNYHNVWNYMEFLIHIRTAGLANLSGIERFVFEEQKNGTLNWFPINRSYHLESKKEGLEETQKDDDMEELKSRKLLDNELRDMTAQLNQLQELLNVRLIEKNRGRRPD